MQKRFHIAIALLGMLVLLRPFDCLAGPLTQKAAACCAKGKCQPSANADDCCKSTVPGGTQLSAPKHVDLVAPLYATVVDFLPPGLVGPSVRLALAELKAPPGSPPRLRLNLPLLI